MTTIQRACACQQLTQSRDRNKPSILKFNLEAILAILDLALSVFPEIYNMAMVSNYGTLTHIAGVGLGVMFINMFVFGTFEGLNGAIDTLVAQYYGSGDYRG